MRFSVPMPQQSECVVRFVFSLPTQIALALKFRLIAYKFARRTITVFFFFVVDPWHRV